MRTESDKNLEHTNGTVYFSGPYQKFVKDEPTGYKRKTLEEWKKENREVSITKDMEDYDRQMFLGAIYYNAKILYENDRGEVYTNAKKLGYLDLLVDEPEFMYQKDLQAGGKGRKKGISIATNVNRKINGAIYVKKWLTEKGETVLSV